MKVKEVMSSPAETISDSATIAEAAQKMKSFDLGVLPVQKDNKIVGMITDRDIVIRVIARKMDPNATMVKQAMTPQVTCCYEDDYVEAAAKMMEDRQIHRLLVINSDNTPVGILSLGDLAYKIRDEHLACEVLEKICEPVRIGV